MRRKVATGQWSSCGSDGRLMTIGQSEDCWIRQAVMGRPLNVPVAESICAPVESKTAVV
jgi:hypothetical protein